MAATTWSPAPYIKKEEWLLSDGSIVVTPDFEASSSGRRVRVVGTTTSVGSRQIDTLVHATIDKIAATRGATRVARLFTPQDHDTAAANRFNIPDTVFTDAINLHLLDENHRGSRRGQKTTAVWKFERSDGVPIPAYVFVTLENRYGGTDYTVQANVVWRNTGQNAQNALSMIGYDGDSAYNEHIYRYSDDHRRLVEQLKNHPPVDKSQVEFGTWTYPSQMRSAVVKYAELCKAFDQFEEISLPDMTDDTFKTHTTYRRVSTNYSATFNSELLDFVQTGPVVERIQANYNALIKDMELLGIVFTEKMGDHDLAQAINGDLKKIRATVRANEDVESGYNDSVDHDHTVAFDFATGTVVVNCGRKEDLEEVTQAWEIAKFKAEMTGEVDVLLAFAKAYRDPKEQKRLRKIIKQRKAPDVTT